MFKIKVTYFLNDAGKAYFPAWFDEVVRETQKQDGFLDMKSVDNSLENAPTVYLDFISEEMLQQWSEKSVHDDLVSKIEPYCIKPAEVEYL